MNLKTVLAIAAAVLAIAKAFADDRDDDND